MLVSALELCKIPEIHNMGRPYMYTNHLPRQCSIRQIDLHNYPVRQIDMLFGDLPIRLLLPGPLNESVLCDTSFGPHVESPHCSVVSAPKFWQSCPNCGIGDEETLLADVASNTIPDMNTTANNKLSLIGIDL